MRIRIDNRDFVGPISCVVSPTRGDINITANASMNLGPYFESLIDGAEHRVEVYDDSDQLYMAANAVFTDTNAFFVNGMPADQNNLSLVGTATGGLPDGKFYAS